MIRHKEVVELLIKAGADVNQGRIRDGISPLYLVTSSFPLFRFMIHMIFHVGL